LPLLPPAVLPADAAPLAAVDTNCVSRQNRRRCSISRQSSNRCCWTPALWLKLQWLRVPQQWLRLWLLLQRLTSLLTAAAAVPDTTCSDVSCCSRCRSDVSYINSLSRSSRWRSLSHSGSGHNCTN
jgi:hypothetical protein